MPNTNDSLSQLFGDQKTDWGQEKLPALGKEFAVGLKPGEFILLEAPFKAADGGRE